MPVADKITNRAVHIQTIINFYNSNIQDLYIHSFSNEIWECSQVTLLLKHQMYHLTFAYWSIQKSVNQIYLYPLYINVENIKNQEKLSWNQLRVIFLFFFFGKKNKNKYILCSLFKADNIITKSSNYSPLRMSTIFQKYQHGMANNPSTVELW